AVHDAGAGPHHLDLPRMDDPAAARAVLVLERALQHVRQDLHVPMAVTPDPLARLDPVVVDHTECAEPQVLRIVVVAERERVPAVEPPQVRAASIVGAPDRHHGLLLPAAIIPRRGIPGTRRFVATEQADYIGNALEEVPHEP